MSKRAMAIIGLDHLSGKIWIGANGIGWLGYIDGLTLKMPWVSSSSSIFKVIRVFGLGSSFREKIDSISSSSG